MKVSEWLPMLIAFPAAALAAYTLWISPIFKAARKARKVSRRRNEDWYGFEAEYDKAGNLVRPAEDSVVAKLDKTFTAIDEISKEFRTNGGSTIKDDMVALRVQHARTDVRIGETEKKLDKHLTDVSEQTNVWERRLEALWAAIIETRPEIYPAPRTDGQESNA